MRRFLLVGRREVWTSGKRVSGMASGLRKSRGRAEVKYQCQGLVPHAEAPRLLSFGNMLERKADNSGQSGPEDCQKNESIGTVNMRPIVMPDRRDGMTAWRTKQNFAWSDWSMSLAVSQMIQEPSNRATSERKMTTASVRR